MKKVTTIILVVSTILFWSCNNSKQKNDKKETKTVQTITKSNIIGEWQCIDVTNGVTHMESIAKMQPHLVFKEDNTIFSKMTLPDGTNMSQKTGNYEIKDGKLVSKFLNNDAFLQNDKLIVNHKDEDNKWIYKKVK
jgi:hypothetical protein